MKKLVTILIIISNLFVITSIVLACFDIQFITRNTSSFFDKMIIWLIYLVFIFISLTVFCIWVYANIHFWKPGNAVIVILLTTLCLFLIFALPMEILNMYFGVMGKNPFPVLFYVFFALFFVLDFVIMFFILKKKKKQAAVSSMIIKSIPMVSTIVILSAFLTVYGDAAIFYLQVDKIALWIKILVTIGSIIYFLIFLIAPLVGIVNFYLLEKYIKD
jgi:hypothetical protein